MFAMPTSRSRLTRAVLAAVLCIAVFPAAAVSAQSLADAARKTEEQRKQTASKVYTNGSLAPSDQPATPPANDLPAAAPAGEQAPADEPAPKPSGFAVQEDKETGHTNMHTAPAETRRTEQYWRKVLADVRAKIAALNANIATQQARIDQVEGNSPAAVREREVLSGTIERIQKDVAVQTRELQRWLALAAASKVPEEWLR